MASGGRGGQVAIQMVLAVVIVGLAYWLYVSITAPYEAVKRAEEVTQQTRQRMAYVRTAMIRYEDENGRYTTSLDSLVMFVKNDSLFQVAADSIFGSGFVPDSLPFSPRTGKRFELIVNDTSRVAVYMLEDPDTGDFIGTRQPDITLLNAASWE